MRCRSPMASFSTSVNRSPALSMASRIDRSICRLIVSARLIDERIDFDVRSPFKKADEFERDNHDDVAATAAAA